MVAMAVKLMAVRSFMLVAVAVARVQLVEPL
jgi:hypothetical protein